MFTTIATFGAPRDVTVSELAVELFFPLDAATAAVFAEASRSAETDPVGDSAAARRERAGG
jgi:hypothetical protein